MTARPSAFALALALALAVAVAVAGCAVPTVEGPSVAAPDPTPAAPATQAATKIVLASELAWDHLNPARGDKAPSAATLWGDRNGSGPTGFLLKPSDGFESPPHIHNVTYRGVVISGLIHNDHPDAPRAWMPTGSYWTQPKGGVHITAAEGSDVLAIIEIEEGPYLVRPTDEAFTADEPPQNIHAAAVPWHPVADGLAVASLWRREEPARSGTLIELAPAKGTTLKSPDATLHAVVVQGRPALRIPGEPAASLEPGSYFTSSGGAAHALSCPADSACVLYVSMNGGELALDAP